MKEYTYKVAGVTFPNDDGEDRQQILKELFDEALECGDELYDTELEEYEFEGRPAIRVLFDRKDVGNIPAADVNNVLDMMKKNIDVAGQVFLKGKDVDEVVLLKDSLRHKKEYGLTEWEIDDLNEELDYLKDDPHYSAKVIIYKPEPEDEITKVSVNEDPEPTPEPVPKIEVKKNPTNLKIIGIFALIGGGAVAVGGYTVPGIIVAVIGILSLVGAFKR